MIKLACIIGGSEFICDAIPSFDKMKNKKHGRLLM
jgi:hypothetical protein